MIWMDLRGKSSGNNGVIYFFIALLIKQTKTFFEFFYFLAKKNWKIWEIFPCLTTWKFYDFWGFLPKSQQWIYDEVLDLLPEILLSFVFSHSWIFRFSSQVLKFLSLLLKQPNCFRESLHNKINSKKNSNR